jgi:hypothetical protein
VARSVDQVKEVSFAVFTFPVERCRIALDRDTAFALDIHAVENLVFTRAFVGQLAERKQTVSERAFAVVDMRDNRKIAYVRAGDIGHSVVFSFNCLFRTFREF